MGKMNRQSQHRPGRDNSKSRELADLKRENHHLKKQVARNRKAAARAVDENNMFTGIDSTTDATPVLEGGVLTPEVLRDAADRLMNSEQPPPFRVVAPGGACSCGGEWRRLDLGPKTVEVCVNCLARRVVQGA